jgi:hypothetical protein
MAEQYTLPHKGRMTARAGSSVDQRNGRPNRRIRAWAFQPKPGTTLEKMEKSFLGALVAVDRVTHRRDESTKSGRFTADGVSQDVLQFALAEAIPVLGRGRSAIREAQREVEALREKVVLRAPDTSDGWRTGLMLRFVDQFRSMTQKERDELTRSPERLDPIAADALLAAPASLTGISEIHHQQLVDRAMQAQHGEAIAELQTLERAIEVAETAIEAARDEVRLEAGVIDRHKFDQLAAPIEQKTSAPWLRRNSQGAVNIVDLDRRIERPATEAEIESGVFAKDFDDYAKVTGRAA